MTIFVMLIGNDWQCSTNISITLRVNTSGEWTVHPSGTPEFILGFYWGTSWSFGSFLCSVLSTIASLFTSFLFLWLMASDNLCGKFKVFVLLIQHTFCLTAIDIKSGTYRYESLRYTQFIDKRSSFYTASHNPYNTDIHWCAGGMKKEE